MQYCILNILRFYVLCTTHYVDDGFMSIVKPWYAHLMISLNIYKTCSEKQTNILRHFVLF